MRAKKRSAHSFNTGAPSGTTREACGSAPLSLRGYFHNFQPHQFGLLMPGVGKGQVVAGRTGAGAEGAGAVGLLITAGSAFLAAGFLAAAFLAAGFLAAAFLAAGFLAAAFLAAGLAFFFAATISTSIGNFKVKEIQH